MLSPIAVPPETSSVPPLMIVLPLSMPPASTLATPPLISAPLTVALLPTDSVPPVPIVLPLSKAATGAPDRYSVPPLMTVALTTVPPDP